MIAVSEQISDKTKCHDTPRKTEYITGYLTHYKAVITMFTTYFNTQELSSLPPDFIYVSKVIR